jgi:putative methyltransferase (TIGR04325 family)
MLKARDKISEYFSDYESVPWSKLRAEVFGAINPRLPSTLDYEKLCDLISNTRIVSGGKLKILDFGGGNLSLYRQVSFDFPDLRLEWTIVENPAYFAEIKVHWGEKQANYNGLAEGFRVGEYSNLLISDRIPAQNFDICIAGAVLGWVDSPIETLNTLIRKADNLLITRTLMAKKSLKLGYQRTAIGENRVRVKCWFLDEDEITSAPNSIILDTWNSSPDSIYTIYGIWRFKSLLLKRVK